MCASSSPSALIAGHRPCDLRVVRELLRRLGIGRIDAAGTGRAAIEMLTRHRPDLLVLDWDIRAESADAVVKAARAAGSSPQILLTIAGPTRESVAAAVALDVDSIVAAPFSPRTFMERVPRLGGRAAVAAASAGA